MNVAVDYTLFSKEYEHLNESLPEIITRGITLHADRHGGRLELPIACPQGVVPFGKLEGKVDAYLLSASSIRLYRPLRMNAPVICMDASTPAPVEQLGLYRVKDWKEAYRLLCLMQDSNKE